MQEKQKAQQLVEEHYEHLTDKSPDSGTDICTRNLRAAIQHAKVTCQEIIKSVEDQLPPLTGNYWRRVLAELEQREKEL